MAASLSVLAASTTVERGGKSTIGSPFSSLGPPAGALEAAKIRYWLGGRPVPEQHVTALRVWTSASKTFSWRSAPFRTHAVSPAPLVPAVAAPLAAAVAAATTTGTARSQLGFWVHEAGCCVAHRPHGQGGTVHRLMVYLPGIHSLSLHLLVVRVRLTLACDGAGATRVGRRCHQP